MTSDTFISMSMNAAVCPTSKEQGKGAAPRWQRSVPPKYGASPEEGSHQAEQMLGAAPNREAGRGSSWARGEPPKSKAAAPAPRPQTCPRPQGAPHPTPAPAAHQARAASKAREDDGPAPPRHPPLVRHHDGVEHILTPGHGGSRPEPPCLSSSAAPRRHRHPRGSGTHSPLLRRRGHFRRRRRGAGRVRTARGRAQLAPRGSDACAPGAGPAKPSLAFAGGRGGVGGLKV